MTFERLRPKTPADVALLVEVQASLILNQGLLARQFLSSYGNLQLWWDGHCFLLKDQAELDALTEAVTFELMVEGCNARGLYL